MSLGRQKHRGPAAFTVLMILSTIANAAPLDDLEVRTSSKFPPIDLQVEIKVRKPPPSAALNAAKNFFTRYDDKVHAELNLQILITNGYDQKIRVEQIDFNFYDSEGMFVGEKILDRD